MPSPYNWSLKQPDFSDLPFFLRSTANKVIDDIVQGIHDRRAIDGGPQQQNKISTILRKKHDHPLIGGEQESPVLAKRSTYRVDTPKPDEAMISIQPIRSQIALYVQRLGYEFFGFSPKAEKMIAREWRRYLKGKLNRILG